jgi:hypothetical protein
MDDRYTKVMVGKLNSLHSDLTNRKMDRPELKMRVDPFSVESILNAYREGNLTFGQAVSLLKPSTQE